MKYEEKRLFRQVMRMNFNGIGMIDGKRYQANPELKKVLRKRTTGGLTILFLLSILITLFLEADPFQNKSLTQLAALASTLFFVPIHNAYCRRLFPKDLKNYLIPLEPEEESCTMVGDRCPVKQIWLCSVRYALLLLMWLQTLYSVFSDTDVK